MIPSADCHRSRCEGGIAFRGGPQAPGDTVDGQSMHRVETNAELASLHAARAGFIFNDFTSTPGAAQNVLHLAGCVWVSRMLDRAVPAQQTVGPQDVPRHDR